MPSIEDFWVKHKWFNARALIKELQDSQTPSAELILTGSDSWMEVIKQRTEEMDAEEITDLLSHYGYDADDYTNDENEPVTAFEAFESDLENDPELQENVGNWLKLEANTLPIYEYYAVSPALAEWLVIHGEVVFELFDTINIWGRRTTGQAVTTDCVIKQIYDLYLDTTPRS